MKTKKLPKKLSSTLSVAIRQAVEDLEACEEDEDYHVYMHLWHSPGCGYGKGRCAVCLAGAVIAKRLGAYRNVFTDPSGYPEHTDLLVRLNATRLGDYPLHGKTKTQEWLRGHDYATDPAKFKRCLLRVAEMLERRGL